MRNNGDYEEIKKRFLKFVDGFLAEEEGTEKYEMIPNFWVVENKKHHFVATIICECKVKDIRSMEKGWFAIVNSDGMETNYLLE